MDDKEPENYQFANLEGENLAGGPSLRTLLLVLLAIIVAAGGVAAWYFELGVSSQVKRERYVKSARQSFSRGRFNEAILAYRNATEADPQIDLSTVLYSSGATDIRIQLSDTDLTA